MVSPELLRRYPFFGSLDDNQLKAIAMISEEEYFEKGDILFEEGQPATALRLLMEGSVEFYYYQGAEENNSKVHKEFLIGEINPGEVFSISGLIEPYIVSATARADQNCRILRIDASALRALFIVDCAMGYNLMQKIARAAMERLAYTRIQLAAARV